MAITLTTKPGFFSLPLELRDDIYQLSVSPDCDNCIHEPPTLHNVCHQMRDESIKWIKDAYSRGSVVLHRSDPYTMHGEMDSRSRALLNFCGAFIIDNEPISNYVDQFHLSFDWVNNITDDDGQPEYRLNNAPVVRLPGHSKIRLGPLD